MAEKKFYWLKLKRDFFKRHDIRIIEEMPNGKDYILFYLKLLVESIDHEGELRFSETIPYNEQMLAVVTNTNLDIVRSAMNIFIELGMIDKFDDSTIFMREVQAMIGSESLAANKKREYRARQKELKEGQCPDNVPEMSSKCPTEKEKEKDIDKEDMSTVEDLLTNKVALTSSDIKTNNDVILLYKSKFGNRNTLVIGDLIEAYGIQSVAEAIDKTPPDVNNAASYIGAVLDIDYERCDGG